MTRTISASVLALSIVAGGFAATPAQASHDVGKFLAGAAALVIIGKAIDNNTKRRRAAAAIVAAPAPHIHPAKTPAHRPHRPKPTPVYQPPVYQPPVYQPPVAPQPVFQGFLPSECGFDVRRGDRSRSVYSKICLSELMTRAEFLPAVCEDRVTTGTGRRTQVYDAICLQSQGFADEAGQYN